MTDNSPTVPIPDPAKLLFDAIYEGDIATATALLDAHPELLTAIDWYNHYMPLHHAAYWGKRTIAEMLLTKGADANGKDGEGRTPLHIHSVYGTSEVVALLIAKGADVNVTDSRGEPPLFCATSKEIAELLVVHGANHRAVGPGGWTALHAAVAQPDVRVDLIEYLIAQGCDVNTRTRDRESPIGRATGNGKADIVAALLAHGANPNRKDRLGWTPLAWAIFNGHKEIVGLLLHYGARLLNRDGDTPLHLAVTTEYTEMVEYLISYGEDVNALNKRSQTPLHHLAWHCQPERGPESQEMAEVLLKHGAHPTLADSEGRTAVHEAIEHGVQVLWVYLLSHGGKMDPFILAGVGGAPQVREMITADPKIVKAVDGRRYTLLHWAAISGMTQTLELLLEGGSDVNAKDRHGNTPLHFAAEHKHGQIARLLLAKGADVNAQNEDQQSPFANAIGLDDHDMMVLLAQAHADVNHQDDKGWTPMHVAAWCGTAGTVAVLLSLQADVNRLSAKGRTPLDLAVGQKNTAVVALLRQNGGKRGRSLRRAEMQG